VDISPRDHADDVIRVWRVPLTATSSERARCEAILSADERERLHRYHFDRERRRFAIARAILRLLLADYLQAAAPDIGFDYGKYGKPSLAGQENDIRFNVSHSEEMAVIAIGRGREVGVDLEYLRPIENEEELVAANFSPREVASYRALQPPDRRAAFFAGWTRKEAYLKACGGGLTIPLAGFTVSLAPGEPALLAVDHDPSEVARWKMVNLAVAGEYAAALVAEGTDWRVEQRDWRM
jgi:4'-phosphopantetheinyl transferase